MFKLKPAYRRPFLVAVILHLCLLSFFLINMPSKQYRMPGPAAQRDAIKAVAVSQADVQQQIKQIRNEEQHRHEERQAEMRRMAQKAATIRKEKLEAERQLLKLHEEQKIAQQKLEQAKAIALEVQKKREEQQKALAEQQKADTVKQKQKVLADTQKKVAAVKQKTGADQQKKIVALKQKQQLDEQRRILQQKLLDQQFASEQAQIAAAQSAEQTSSMQGVIDRYVAQIKVAIESNLLKPSNYEVGQYCVYTVQLAPGGVVISAELSRSSGNSALDQAAREAIFRTSPLPVPQDPAEFERFRVLRLKLNPYQ